MYFTTSLHMVLVYKVYRRLCRIYTINSIPRLLESSRESGRKTKRFRQPRPPNYAAYYMLFCYSFDHLYLPGPSRTRLTSMLWCRSAVPQVNWQSILCSSWRMACSTSGTTFQKLDLAMMTPREQAWRGNQTPPPPCSPKTR